MVKELKALQDCLGDFQDGEVQRRTVGEFVTQMTNEATVPTDTLLAMGELAAQVDTAQAPGPQRLRRPLGPVHAGARTDRRSRS